MERQKISIIVPVYKVEAFLDRCVQSIADQTYRNLEIILVDDGSPDNCPAICDIWAEKDSRIKVIHKTNGGLSDARNAGMAIVTGELMGFVDSDDWIAPEMYQLLYENMQQNDSDISACGVQMVWEDGAPSRPLTKAGHCVLNQEDAMRAIIEESWLKQPVWYKLYKTALIRDIPFPVGKYHEDVFWSYQAVGRAEKVSVFDTPCYFYLQRGNSIMSDGYSLKRLDALEARAVQNAYIAEHFPTLLPDANCSLFFSCLYYYQQTIQHLSGENRRKAAYTIKNLFNENKLNENDRRELPFKQKVWAVMASCSLELTCRIRNMLGIGM